MELFNQIVDILFISSVIYLTYKTNKRLDLIEKKLNEDNVYRFKINSHELVSLVESKEKKYEEYTYEYSDEEKENAASDLENYKTVKKLFMGGNCGVYLCYIASNRLLFTNGFCFRFMNRIKSEMRANNIYVSYNEENLDWWQSKIWDVKDLESREKYLDRVIKELESL